MMRSRLYQREMISAVDTASISNESILTIQFD